MEDKPKTHRIWALEIGFQGPNFIIHSHNKYFFLEIPINISGISTAFALC